MNQPIESIISKLSLRENRTLNDFEVIKKLGTSNKRKFNEVYLVQNTRNGALGVLKKLGKTAQNSHLWNVLKSESLIEFTLNGLPKTIFFTENEKEILLIRNYQQGTALNEFWKVLDTKNQWTFVKELIKGLIPIFKEMHSKKIVHCDIKPSNILVFENGKSLEFSLIDFGMAIDQSKIEKRKTLFALGFSAPEIILNRLYLVDQTSDIFALGISIWQLYAGKLPLTHPNPSIMTNLQITHPLPAHGKINKSLQQILAKMCVKHPFKLPPNLMKSAELDLLLEAAKEARFQDLESVLIALEAIIERPTFGILSFLKKK